MSDEVLIKVENVGKKFCRSLKRSMLYGVEDIVRDTLSLKTTSDKLRPEEFWAVDDVSFEVRRGECLGIIGRNGAGKSTLLKMLNGIFMPDKGKITIKGKVGALIEVGAGFHPMLTGRENIYVNGAILGMSKREIDKKFDEIVAFAELEEFIDMPVKHYSSGMYVRLGFAIAAQMEPDVLILDEVLAVGDVGFRTKCYNQIYKLVKKSAVIFVSHSMPQVARLCSNSLLLNAGKVLHSGETNSMIIEYEKLFSTSSSVWSVADGVTVMGISINGIRDIREIKIKGGESLVVYVALLLPRKVKHLEASLSIHQPSLDLISHINSKQTGKEIVIVDQECRMTIKVPSLTLGNGRKLLTITLRDSDTQEILLWASAAWELNVINSFVVPAPVYHHAVFQIDSGCSTNQFKNHT